MMEMDSPVASCGLAGLEWIAGSTAENEMPAGPPAVVNEEEKDDGREL